MDEQLVAFLFGIVYCRSMFTGETFPELLKAPRCPYVI